MASSETEICNLALAHLGDTQGIAALTERSTAARSCALWYPQIRDEVLADFPWPFATRSEALALVATFSSPSEWAYSYRYPSDALAVWRILPYGRLRVPSSTNIVPFREVSDATGRLLYVDLPAATVEFTFRITDPTRYPPAFVAALALKLAAALAPQLTAGDPNKLGLRALQLYDQQLEIARNAALNGELADPPAESSFITERY